MSDSHHHDAPHEGPIKTPKQLILAVFFAFVVPIVGILLLVSYVASDHKPAAGSDGLSAEAVARRIQPVGTVEVKDVNDVSTMKSGEQVFTAQCAACHSTGAAGAPKFGDAAAWGPRIGQGFNALLKSALHGKGNMGPQGGGDFSDLEIARAVAYMANKGGAKFDEPKAPAPAGDKVTAEATAAAASATGAGAAQQVAAALASTTTPAKTEATAPTGAAATAGGAVPALYTQTCQVCHAAGVAGAPKVGDKAAWAARIGQGIDGLTASAIKGKGAMPPKGGAASASDADIKAVVSYMVNASK
ncbi:c-type cytochrome [Ideonella sp. BN130291]|uniref:c-type cytochrome n=1 Tax=Ideonella sp. BN130291 TaxID=3112940 RepID=UPI002E26D82F|nr:c-type cytochrome [Ideonella sp. BN130291]